MNIFKSHKHTMCFRSLLDCWWERSPGVITIMFLSIYIPLANFLMESVVGKLYTDIETSRNTVDGILTIVYQHMVTPEPVQMLMYSLMLTIAIYISIIFFRGFCILVNEIRTIPATIKECQCEQDEK